jgi:catechol 2,3-dioxygenase-like lactoylglutathione lyase family enzyme/predicted enzyme related to lactoylglutathione lyase
VLDPKLASGAALMFGRFLELGIATTDIAESVQFYERLGFSQLITGDAWSHRYGVLSDGRAHLGLHERTMPSPALTFVLPQLASSQPRLRAAKFESELAALGDDSLHQLRLRDPAGHAVTLLEARTYSPAAPGADAESLCGYFSHLSLPQVDYEAAREFWERAGFVALPEQDQPIAHLPLTSDHLDLGFHRRRTFDAPLLVFECADVTENIARVRERGISLSLRLPGGLDRGRSALIEAPEGTALLLLQAVG